MPRPARAATLVGLVLLTGCANVGAQGPAAHDPPAGAPTSPESSAATSAAEGSTASERPGSEPSATTTEPHRGLEGRPNLLALALDGSDGDVATSMRPDADGLIIDVVTLDGGVVTTGRDSAEAAAFRFPSYATGPQPPRAIVRVQEVADPGALRVDDLDFTFGADFAVDDRSEGAGVDGGNNLIQRGLASDGSQFKIDIDDGMPLCRIEGDGGVLEARIHEEVRPQEWYRVRCARRGEAIRLSLTPITLAGPTAVATASGPLGRLSFRAGLPLSIGGKLAANGAVIRSTTDQFNGLVSEPYLVVADRDAGR